MAQLIVRKLDDAVKERLEARAARNGRTPEDEARAVLEEATEGEALPVLRNNERSFGELMRDAFKDIGLTDEEWRRFNTGIADINSGFGMRIPDFEADEYEEATSDK